MAILTKSRFACNARPQVVERKGGRDPRAGGAPLSTDAPRTKAHGTAPFDASLGIYAKSKNKPVNVDPETGEILGLDPMGTRVQRFILQSVARSFFPKSRLDKCLRLRSSSQDIEVWKSVEHKTTHFKGLQTCGSVWRCPVCSAKIAERRRAEILHAKQAHKLLGGCVNLLTLTCPHRQQDDLAELLEKQAKAINGFFNDRPVKALLLQMGTIGKIKALEVTHGRKSAHNNGWHPHYHLLMFQGAGDVSMAFDAQQMTDFQVRLYLRWANACKRAGLGEPSYAHGLKLDDGSKAANYVSKWGLEDEMTKGHTKKALHGETPFDFLRAYLVDAEDKQAAALFIEFARTFEGKRQLTWSKGLKARYSVQEKSDEVLSGEADDKALLLGSITLEQWRDVLAVEGRAVVLSIAAASGWDGVTEYLQQIRGAAQAPVKGLYMRGGAGSLDYAPLPS